MARFDNEYQAAMEYNAKVIEMTHNIFRHLIKFKSKDKYYAMRVEDIYENDNISTFGYESGLDYYSGEEFEVPFFTFPKGKSPQMKNTNAFSIWFKNPPIVYSKIISTTKKPFGHLIEDGEYIFNYFEPDTGKTIK